MRANIVSWESGGLGVDIDVIAESMSLAGVDVRFKGRRSRTSGNPIAGKLATVKALAFRTFGKVVGKPSFDINVFVESIFPEFLPDARLNCLFVNQEWFRETNLPHLASIDYLLCKSQAGVDAMRHFPVPTINVGFTSPDRRMIGYTRSGPLRCLHVAGGSALKGTEAVVEAWSRHPEWPELTIVRRQQQYGGATAPALPELPNVRVLADFLSDRDLRELQNACEIHVAPSQAEGYGHVIGEAMSCGALVITSNAPPMNELVSHNRGLLVDISSSEPFLSSQRYFVDVDHLERMLDVAISMSPVERRLLGEQARKWYDEERQRFYSHMSKLLNEVLFDRIRSTPKRVR